MLMFQNLDGKGKVTGRDKVTTETMVASEHNNSVRHHYGKAAQSKRHAPYRARITGKATRSRDSTKRLEREVRLRESVEACVV